LPDKSSADSRRIERAKKAGIKVVIHEREAVDPGPESEILFELHPAKFRTEAKKYRGTIVLRFWTDRFRMVATKGDEVLDVTALRGEIVNIKKAPILGHAVDFKDGDGVLIKFAREEDGNHFVSWWKGE